MIVTGNIVDVVNKRIYYGELFIENGMIITVEEQLGEGDVYILPGFIDSHIHIESSMLIPSEFAKLAVRYGTIATVSDPHEIANVCGVAGLEYMLRDASNSPVKFNFGVPACVPATEFETSGANLDGKIVRELLSREEFKYLSEVMNYPGAIYKEASVMRKIIAAQEFFKPIDGHAPGLKGDDLKKYASVGITTDHESVTMVEALQKIEVGMKTLIREGSASKNFEALFSLIDTHPDDVMLCSDDLHPDDLMNGYLNELLRRGVGKGLDIFNILRAVTVNPIRHYGLQMGLLRRGDPADFIVVKDLKRFNVLQTYIDGQLVFDNGKVFINNSNTEVINVFKASPIAEKDLYLTSKNDKVTVIEAHDNSLTTTKKTVIPKRDGNEIVCDLENDILKIVVLNRYKKSKPAVALINNFGLKRGAIAGTVAHDSHNIIAVGTSDKEIVTAINTIVSAKGGIVAVDGNEIKILELPIAGLMSNKSGEEVGRTYKELTLKAKEMGSKLTAPFMTLSFMGLLVIPELKISDKGLFDVDAFRLTTI